MSDQPATRELETGNTSPLWPEAVLLSRKPTPAECVAMGGHCWPDDGLWVLPSEGSSLLRTCKHCGLTQRGTRQDAVKWEDADA